MKGNQAIKQKKDERMEGKRKEPEKSFIPEDDEGNKVKWNSLEHHGVLFPELYAPNQLKLRINGEKYQLSREQEEACLWWAKIMDSDFAAKPHVHENFLSELTKLFGGKDCPFGKLEELDFTAMTEFCTLKDEERKNRTKEEKKKEKEEKDKLTQLYGYAIVDGRIERVSNYIIEPPGIFRGRGEHPLAGKLKPRIWPDSVTINVGIDNPVPVCTVPGMAWKQVVHKNESTWLASYKDDIHSSSNKYVFLDASSKFKGENDKKKYEKARKLKSMIEVIRKDYMEKMGSKDEVSAQLGTTTYLIDKLALRVGNEKTEDEADTVGCCSLRVQHLQFPPEENMVTLDFLGKDSMRYFNTIEVIPVAYKNLLRFSKGKQPTDDLFDRINASRLNEYLKSLMPELSAKCFRTFNASITLQRILNKMDNRKFNTVDDKVKFYTDANREVAILCNHQKTVSKNFGQQVEKMQEKLKEKLMTALNDHLQVLNGGKKKAKASSVQFKLPNSAEATEKAIERLSKIINKMENNLKSKEENKEVALGTSKINYMDPRISISWCKEKEVPIEKIFPKTLRSKFSWAMSIDPAWQF